MLVLTRKANESIHIGKDIIIHFLECGKEVCKVGITAPKHINIIRNELIGTPKEVKRHAISGNR